MTEIQELTAAINSLRDSIESLEVGINQLTSIQTDIFNTDSSTDDITSLKGKIQRLIDTIERKL